MNEIRKTTEEIAREVRREFDLRGISLKKAAEMLGVAVGGLSLYTKGKRPFGSNIAKKWEETFGFSATFLMTGEGSLVPGEQEAPTAPASTAAGGVFIPAETLELYNSMAESIRNLTELLKMKGGVSSFVDFGEKNTYPHKKP